MPDRRHNKGVVQPSPVRDDLSVNRSRMRALVSSRLLWAGLALLVVGTGPLLIWIAISPNSNPVGPGILTFFTFWPSIGLIVVGVAIGVWRALEWGKQERQRR